MPRLQAISGPDPGRTWEVRSLCLLGRAPTCGARVEDPSVSREHARLSLEEGNWVLVDLESRNGTFVNGARVSRVVVAPGDEIALGRARLRFVEDPPAAAIDEEVVLEGEPSASPPPLPASAPTRVPPPPSPPPPRVPTPGVEAPARPLSPVVASRFGVRRLEGTGTLLVRGTGLPGEGLLREDLGQRGTLFRVGIFLALLVLAGGVFLAAKALTGILLPPQEEVPLEEEGDR